MNGLTDILAVDLWPINWALSAFIRFGFNGHCGGGDKIGEIT